MKTPMLITCIVLCCLEMLEAQHRPSNKHTFRPGISLGYLPGWVDGRSLEPKKRAGLFMAGIYGHQQIWNESVLIMGISYGKLVIEKEEEFKGILLPLKLQKYFNPERKGFNLAVGMIFNYCKTCDEKSGGALLYEINYLFDVHSFKVNVGIQPILGPIFDDGSIFVGGQVQLIWSPMSPKERK